MTGTVRNSAAKDVAGKLREIEVRYAWDRRDRLQRRVPRDIPHEYSASDLDRPLGFHWHMPDLPLLDLPRRRAPYEAAAPPSSPRPCWRQRKAGPCHTRAVRPSMAT